MDKNCTFDAAKSHSQCSVSAPLEAALMITESENHTFRIKWHFPSYFPFPSLSCSAISWKIKEVLSYQGFPPLSSWGFISQHLTSPTLPKLLEWMKMWNMPIPQIPNTGFWRSLVGTSPDLICHFYISLTKVRESCRNANTFSQTR